MDHSEHNHDMADSADMNMGHRCSMNMLFTWSTDNLCIVFREWHITGPISLFFSLLAIVVLCAGYELVRDLARRYELRQEAAVPLSATPEETSSLLPGRNVGSAGPSRQVQVTKAAFYAVQVFYSFFIMLLFMTYNGWIMLSVAVGAFLGFLMWGNGSASKTAACH